MKYIIRAVISYSAYFQDVEMNILDYHVKLVQTNKGLLIQLEDCAEEEFWLHDDQTVISNVNVLLDRILPFVNAKLLEIKYFGAHLLITTVSLLDIHTLIIESKVNKEVKIFSRPYIYEYFPPLVGARENDEIFIRDFVEAMTSYFRYDLDGCVRKGITSFENYLDFMGIQGKDKALRFKPVGKRPTFMSKAEEYHKKADNFIMPPRIVNAAFRTIWLIYELRNRIVHNKVRLLPQDRWVCCRMIYCLYNVYNTRIGVSTLDPLFMSRIISQFTIIDRRFNSEDFSGNYTLVVEHDKVKYLCERFNLKIPEELCDEDFPCKTQFSSV